jgi:hypothetical protein
MPKLRKANAIVRHVAGDWQVSGVIRLQSGPYSTVTGSTSTGTRRSDYLGGDIYAQSGQNINNWLNKAAFATASNGAWGNSGMDIVEAPGLQSYDLSLAKHFRLTERINLRFQADFYNAPNVANFSGLNTTITSSAYGTMSSAYPPRQIQLALKLAF